MSDKAFADSNVLLYLASADARKADIAERILDIAPVVSVQVLNELANVARRKMKLPWGDVREFLSAIRSICPTVDLTIETHELGLQIGERYGLSTYDAMIVAAALLERCSVLYSEDMQHAMVISGTLEIRNPFLPA